MFTLSNRSIVVIGNRTCCMQMKRYGHSTHTMPTIAIGPHVECCDCKPIYHLFVFVFCFVFWLNSSFVLVAVWLHAVHAATWAITIHILRPYVVMVCECALARTNNNWITCQIFKCRSMVVLKTVTRDCYQRSDIDSTSLEYQIYFHLNINWIELLWNYSELFSGWCHNQYDNIGLWKLSVTWYVYHNRIWS